MTSLPNEHRSPSREHGAPAEVQHPVRPFYWSVRREFWEQPWLYFTPLIIAGIVLVGFLISTSNLPNEARQVALLGRSDQARALTRPYNMAAMALCAATPFIGAFYCLRALNLERRDRSLLFWKSWPVSDTVTVLAKMCIPIIILPLLVALIAMATQVVMLLIETAILWANGLDSKTLWTHIPWFSRAVVLPYGLLTLSLWHAPMLMWMLLMSAWARRTTMLWALLPPIALCLIEKMALNTRHLADLLNDRFSGHYELAFTIRSNSGSILFSEIAPFKFLGHLATWTGLGLAAVFVATAIWLRRHREPT